MEELLEERTGGRRDAEDELLWAPAPVWRRNATPLEDSTRNHADLVVPTPARSGPPAPSGDWAPCREEDRRGDAEKFLRPPDAPGGPVGVFWSRARDCVFWSTSIDGLRDVSVSSMVTSSSSSSSDDSPLAASTEFS